MVRCGGSVEGVEGGKGESLLYFVRIALQMSKEGADGGGNAGPPCSYSYPDDTGFVERVRGRCFGNGAGYDLVVGMKWHQAERDAGSMFARLSIS